MFSAFEGFLDFSCSTFAVHALAFSLRFHSVRGSGDAQHHFMLDFTVWSHPCIKS